MANRPAPYTQADVTRAVKGAVAAGVVVGRIEFDLKSGRIAVYSEGQSKQDDPNPWDKP